jgi:hypothetical protein
MHTHSSTYAPTREKPHWACRPLHRIIAVEVVLYLSASCIRYPATLLILLLMVGVIVGVSHLLPHNKATSPSPRCRIVTNAGWARVALASDLVLSISGIYVATRMILGRPDTPFLGDGYFGMIVELIMAMILAVGYVYGHGRATSVIQEGEC